MLTKTNLSFDHGEVNRFNMQCTSCHSNVVQGAGEVPRERCNTCHNDPMLLQRYGETRILHKAHVTDHKIDCTNCHLEIQHTSGRQFASAPPASNACSTCHRDGHSAAKDLYAGTGGKGLDPMPSKMNQVGIRCEGCHFLPQEGLRSTVAKASEVSCMSCHGARYNKILGRWKSLIDSRLQQAKAEFGQARNLFPASHESGPLADAYADIQLVDRGVGVHNIEYSLALLDASHNLINKALDERGHAAFAKKWTEAPFESSCFRCHRGIEQQTGRIFGLGFIHKPHIAAGFECATCHRPHEDKPAGELVRFGREGCANCHHQREQQKPEACLRCHTDLFTRKIAFKGKQFDHSFHFKDLSQKCADCHLSSGTIRRAPVMKTCEACHPGGFN